MSPPTTPISLQPHHHTNLILILRNANVHYQHIANTTRQSLRPTHHAKKHASLLGLSVDIKKAANCCQRQISVIPLPILDTSPSPTASTTLHQTRDHSHEWEGHQLDIPHSTSGLTPLSSSLLPAPSVLRGVPRRGPGSRFSVTPIDTIPKIRVSEAKHTDTMAVDNDNEDADTTVEMPATPVLSHRELPDVPVNEDELHWDLESVDMEISPVTSAYSNSSSSGPVTPNDITPLTICIKRKPVELGGVEKRPRYGRKQWVVPTTQRRIARLPFRN